MAELSDRRLKFIVAGIMLSLFLASMEGTVVATAMPTIVAQLGGLSIYSWVFAVYMLASTTTVPIYGKLSDLFGRKIVYITSMFLFLIGSILCGFAQSMEQLILFRAVQGIGAGGVLPLAFIIIGDLFSLEQRAHMQGLFSGVWGVSSVIGPLIGGFLVDQVSWQWVFFINVVPVIAAAALVWFAWQDVPRAEGARPAIDTAGVVLLTLGVLSLLLGLDQPGSLPAAPFLGAAVVMLGVLPLIERRAADPILPPGLFRDRLFLASILHGILAGWAVFGGLNYVPLFVQAVLGTTATEAGISLTPMSLAWTLASVVASRLLLHVDYRALTIAGMISVAVGMFLMSTVDLNTSLIQVMVYTGMMGAGMGLCIPSLLIAVQSTVRKQELGIATSTMQFFRSIGGTLGVSVLGAFLSTRLAALLLSSGVDPNSVALDELINPETAAAAATGPLRELLGTAISEMFLIGFAAAVAGLLVVLIAPKGKIAQLMERKNNQGETS